MLYKRKAITRTFKLERATLTHHFSFCNSYSCPIMLYGMRNSSGCSDLCYRLSDYNSTYEQYKKHKLRYIGM